MRKFRRLLQVGMALAFLLVSQISLAQSMLVQGTVTGDLDGEPIIGANIVISGTTQGTITDYEGNYQIEVPNGETYLEISYIGFKNQKVLANASQIDIILEEDVQNLEELVVIGYGVVKKSDLTGAVSSMKAEEITQMPVQNAGEALQGRVTGVQVTTANGSPGAAPVIRVRGVASTGDSNPLYVVDGMIVNDINWLSPSDIESMEVLKDASATAIYGARGANGVVMISTKKGEKGKATITYDGYVGVQSAYERPKMANGDQYYQFATDLMANDGQDYDWIHDAKGTNFNWLDQMLTPALMQSHTVSAMGGNDKATYNLSLNAFNQDGVMEGSEFNRLTLRFNNTFKITDRITFGNNVSLSTFRRDEAHPDAISQAYKSSPLEAAYLEDGSFVPHYVGGNPSASAHYFNKFRESRRIVGNFYLNFELPKNFNFKTSLGIDYNTLNITDYTPEYRVSDIQNEQRSLLWIAREQHFMGLWENILTWNKDFGKHSLNAMGGMTAQLNQFNRLNGQRYDVPWDENLWYLNMGSTEGQSVQHTGSESAVLSGLARVNYTYDSKYLLTVSMRADASSRFGINNRVGYFPSAALGWNISREPFLQSQDWLSELKLRASVGRTGNDRIGDYEHLATMVYGGDYIFNNQIHSGIFKDVLENPDLKWETSTQYDFGVNAGFLDDRLQVEMDYYLRYTNDLLLATPILSQNGFASVITNIGEISNQGFEFSADWKETVNDFSYSFGVNATTIKNEVRRLGSDDPILGGGVYGGNQATRTEVGLPIGAFYGYKTDGVYSTQEELDNNPSFPNAQVGDVKYLDTNGDGEITEDDKTYLGSPLPSLIYGFHLGFDYKGWDFGMVFQGTYGNKIYNGKEQARNDAFFNIEERMMDYWTEDNPNAAYPRPTAQGRNLEVSDRFIEDGSYLRLSSVTLGYTFDQEWTRRFKVDRWRVYASGNNLVTFSQYSGFTPDITAANPLNAGIDMGVYPIPATFTVGTNITF
ncbi:TonB-dependent receptor [Persicobacter diffluens]|uniref:SusC/RagA family TonB-linked outer membrane protein n=1 Tax=Persicobacter diffluens TaxID=981 RepID=A0AAN4W2I0_9BACT|nr:SusC/RagA family TonB-linked outer membrane protein [Persicobacter diffluens]